MSSEPDEIRRRLHRLSVEKPRFDYRVGRWMESLGVLKPAGVLIPITQGRHGMEVVLTKRSTNLRNHSGEVSFPGGRADEEDDSLVVTALRESLEEISLNPDDVTVFGALLSMPTVTGYAVTAYVGEFPYPYDLCPNPDEIEEMFTAPLSEIADPSIHRTEKVGWKGLDFDVHYFDYGEHLVWGATGLMLNSLIEYLNLRDA